MSKPATCTCQSPSDFTWHKSPCNEEGWHCLDCGDPAPGEPPGYRPDLDVTHLGSKVESLLMDLHHDDIVYMSNSTDGDCCVRAVVEELRASGYYDQYSVVRAIMDHANRTHADYWKAQGDAIRAGEDKRERCACGKLAAGHQSWGPPRCLDCFMDQGLGLFAATRDPSEGEGDLDPWEAYGIWERHHRATHPDEYGEHGEFEPDSLALIDVYARTPMAEMRGIWDAERARRGGGGR